MQSTEGSTAPVTPESPLVAGDRLSPPREGDVRDTAVAYWMWILLGLALLAFEVLTPGGFFALFFGAAALFVAALAGLDVVEGPTLQWATFGTVGTVSLVTLRRHVTRWFGGNRSGKVDQLQSEPATVIEAMTSGGRGRVELRGTPWSAQNDGDQSLQAGERARVLRVSGLTLHVKKEDS